MTENIKFTLVFPKFSDDPIRASFSSGINIVYGESGVGKSDLIRQLLKLPPLGDCNFLLISKSLPDSIQVVFQNPDNQIVASTISRELAFAVECVENNPAIIKEKITDALKMLPESIKVDRHPATLSGGEKEILNITNAIAASPKAILIDDGLSFLSSEWKIMIVAELNKLARANGTIIIWFTSEINDCQFAADTWELDLSNFRRITPPKFIDQESGTVKPGKLEVDIADLNYGYESSSTVFQKYSASYSGVRSLGIEGLNGSGKTTLAKLLIGMVKRQSGRCTLKLPNLDRPPTIGYLDQFPERMFNSGTLDNLASDLMQAGLLDPDRFMQCKRRMPDFQVKWELLGTKSVATISWSALRFGLIFLLAHCNYDILVLDEPTFGLGQEQRARLAKFIKEYLNNNYMILVSHDRKIIDAVCDGIITLEGKQFSHKKESVLDPQN